MVELTHGAAGILGRSNTPLRMKQRTAVVPSRPMKSEKYSHRERLQMIPRGRASGSLRRFVLEAFFFIKSICARHRRGDALLQKEFDWIL